MKFSERLTELRKKEGLSQEDLGYKLNVTRQTISKWELGQTTPEMDKLIEISKLFNISVDELINESENTPNQNPIMNEKQINTDNINNRTQKNNIKIIILAIVAVVVIFLIVKLIAFSGIFEIFKGIKDEATSIINQTIDQIDQTKDQINQTIEDNQNMVNSTNTDNNESKKNMEKFEYNSRLEMYKGTTVGGIATRLLDNIITLNKTNDRKIIVKYGKKETKKEKDIREIKQKLSEFDKYDVIFEYDEEGYINKATIEKI